ncbi:MAG TPA: class I SAM-dependent methyltransferase [Acidimicrobiia bacterium]|nr:class I SAM-dependent methyltransferase [Acidimicrobiia bacterium]
MSDGQFHLNANTYLEMIRAEIPNYDDLQAALAAATVTGHPAERILDLGSGTGETAKAVLRRHPNARLVGIDASADMLEIADAQLPHAEFVASDLEDPLPPGPFDLVVSAFAVHHLDGLGKQGLFGRIAKVLGPEGRFVMLDVVVPTEPVAAPIALEEGVDLPSMVEDMLGWLLAAGFEAEVTYSGGDIAILTATRV